MQNRDDLEKEVESLHARIRELEGELQRIQADSARRVSELEALQKTVLDITAAHDLATLLETIVERAARLLDAPAGGLYLCEPEEGLVHCVVSYKTEHDYRGVILRYGEGAAGTVASTGEPLLIEDYSSWAGRAPFFEEEQPFKAVLAVPMIWQDEVLGVIDLLRYAEGRTFDESDRDLLALFANHAALAVANTRLYEEAQAEIAERRQLEQQIEERRRYLEHVLACAPDAIVTLDPQQRILEWNPGAETLFGYRAEEAIGRDLDELISAPDAAMHAQARGFTAAAHAGQSIPPTETIRFRQDGTPVHVILTGSPILIEGELRGTVAVYTDITAYKEAAEELRRISDFNQRIVQNMAEGIAVQDSQGTITFVNPAAADMLGYALEDLVGQDWTLIVPPDQQPIVRAADERRRRGEADQYELELERRDGTRLPVLVSGSPLYDPESGRFEGTLAVYTDISRRVEYEQRVARHGREMAALYETMIEINARPDLPRLLTAIGRRAAELLDARASAIYLMKPNRQEIEMVVGYNLPQHYVGTTHRLGEGLSGRVAQTGEPLMIADYDQWSGRSDVYKETIRRILSVPLKVRGRIIGVITVADDQRTELFDEDDLRLVGLLADQAAIAIENARLFETAREQRDLAEALREAISAVSGTLHLEEILDRILEQVDRVIPNDALGINLLQDDGQGHIIRARGYEQPGNDAPAASLRLSGTPALRLMQETGEPIIISDTATDPRWIQIPELAWIRSCVGAPIRARGEIVGFLNVDSATPGFYDESHVTLLRAFADEASLAIENARLFEETRRQAEYMAAINRIGIAISSALELDEVLNTLYELIRHITDVAAFYVALYDEETGQIEFPLLSGLRGLARAAPTNIHEQPGLTAYVIKSRKPLYIPDVQAIPEDAPYTPLPLTDKPPRSYLGIPLMTRERVIGVLSIQSYEPDAYTSADADLLATISIQAAIAIENARLFQAEREQRQLAEALSQATAAVSGKLELDQVLDEILEQVSRVVPADSANIMLIKEGRVHIVRWHGYHEPGDEEYLRAIAFDVATTPNLRKMYETGQPLVIPDVKAHSDWTETLSPVQSYAGAPIRVRDEVIGFLNINKNTPGFFDETHAAHLQAFANQTGLAIGNARLFSILEQSKRDWETTFDAMQDAVALVDREGHIVRANRAFARLTGSTFPQIINRIYWDVLEGHVCPETVCTLQQALAQDQPATCIHEYRGRVFEIEATPVPADALDRARSAASVIYVLRDITERRLAEAEIRRRNRELTLLNRVIAATAASWDANVILEIACRELALALDVPQAAAAIINKEGTAAVVVAEYLTEGRPPALGIELPVKGNPSIEYLFEHKAPFVVEDARTDPRLELMRDISLQRGTISLLVLPLIVEGEVIGSLGVDAIEPRSFTADEMNMAQRVADQVSSALARARLEETQRRLNAAVEQAAESIIIADTQGVVVYVNPAFERSSGYSAAEAIGHSATMFRSDKHDPEFYQNLWQTLTRGEVWQGRIINRRKDGSLYTEESTITPVRDQRGEIVNFVAVNHDVTREVQLEEQLRQAQKMEALGQLAGGIAHDFNNLLTVIQLSTRLLQRQLGPQDPGWEYVQRIEETSQRATTLTRRLLSFSRRELIEPRTLNINQAVSELSLMLKRIIGEDIELLTDLEDDLWSVRVDPTQLDQIIMNLVVNARDAMPQGGTLLIETSNAILDEVYAAQHVDVQAGEYVQLAITDTGVGIDEEARPHIFEPFFTTKERGQGTGLGLAAVFGIVKQNKGHIWFYSEKGLGTTFRIYLPRVTKPGTPSESRALTPAIAGLVQGTETVLVVEDEAEVLNLVVRVLKACGYQVLIAEDGPQALKVSGEYAGPIDLLITDVVMPRMYGKELAEQLRAQREEMRLLFMSGYPDKVVVQQSALLPNVAFLPKPFTVEDLTAKVRAVLDSQGPIR